MFQYYNGNTNVSEILREKYSACHAVWDLRITLIICDKWSKAMYFISETVMDAD